MKLKNLLYITVGSALLTACSADYLDTLPQSSTDTGTVFETTENARLAVNGLCLMMTQQYLGQQGVNGEGTIKTWYGNYPGNDFQKCNLTGWADIINGTSFHERNSSLYCYYPWFYYYKLIGNANRIVAYIDQAEGPEAERLFIRAQALTVRAYAYLMLSQLYCHRWADSNQGASRGLPLRIDTSDGDLPASTLAQVYTQIYTDLDAAVDAYTRSGLTRSRDDNHSPDLSVACAVYARAALTREDWATAASADEQRRLCGRRLQHPQQRMDLEQLQRPRPDALLLLLLRPTGQQLQRQHLPHLPLRHQQGALRPHPCDRRTPPDVPRPSGRRYV